MTKLIIYFFPYYKIQKKIKVEILDKLHCEISKDS